MSKASKIKIVDKKDSHDDLLYWLSKSPSERIDAVEFLRQQYYVISGLKHEPRLIRSIQMRPMHK